MTPTVPESMNYLPDLDALGKQLAQMMSSNHPSDGVFVHQVVIGKMKNIQEQLEQAKIKVHRSDYGSDLTALKDRTDEHLQELEARLSGALERQADGTA